MQSYVEFLYQRSQLFVQFAEYNLKIENKKNPQNKC